MKRGRCHMVRLSHLCTTGHYPGYQSMLRYLKLVIISFCLLLSAGRAAASHLFGGELLYTHQSGDLYKVTLTLYADCGTQNPILVTYLYTAHPLVTLAGGSLTDLDSIYLNPEPGTGDEVSPVCPAMIAQTYCNGGTLPGVRRFIFSDTITIPSTAANWKFQFRGYLGSGGNSAGRSSNITNIYDGNTFVYLEALLNNTQGPNSSPVYHTIPTPFYCINVLQQYNHGATDPDADSLSFALVPGLNGASSSLASVSYVYPYTPTAPMATTPGGFSFNAINGQMTFIPNIQQDALIVSRVSEYHNGILVGTSEREMTFVVQSNCNGVPPTSQVSSISGGVVTEGNIINVCVGSPNVNFVIGLTNPSGDTNEITLSGIPASASAIVHNNYTPQPTINFSWATGALPVGHYTFYVSIKTDHCPLASTQTIAYTINVAAPPQLQVTQLGGTGCVHQAPLAYNILYGFPPRTITVLSGGSTIKTLTDTTIGDTAVVRDSLPAGTYAIVVRSDVLCQDTAYLTIIDSGKIDLAPVTEDKCIYDPSLPVYIAPVKPGAAIAWFDVANNPLGTPPVVNTSVVGTYSWYFIETYSVCTSGPVPYTASVHPKPVGQITGIQPAVCYGDDVYLQATGGTEYVWHPEELIKKDTGLYIEVLQPVVITVDVQDQYGCKDTASIAITNVMQCCRFSYPNAFSPNKNGVNDGFRVVTYGNMRNYSLAIYNRWGQRVFFTADPDKRWDGTFNGEPCDIGTYYYYMDAECLTGQKEQHSGDVTLVK